jgi:hypothetical protein
MVTLFYAVLDMHSKFIEIRVLKSAGKSLAWGGFNTSPNRQQGMESSRVSGSLAGASGWCDRFETTSGERRTSRERTDREA